MSFGGLDNKQAIETGVQFFTAISSKKEAFMEENTNINVDTTAEEQVENEKEKTYTFEEVQKLIASETDRRTNQALKKQAKEYEKKLSLEKLDATERASAEKDMQIAELQEKLKSFEIEKNKSEMMRVLSARGMSADFVDLIAMTDDVEECQRRIDTLDKLFKDEVAREVKKRLATSSPVVGTGDNNAMTKDKFRSMSIAEQNKLYETNPELFNKLIN